MIDALISEWLKIRGRKIKRYKFRDPNIRQITIVEWHFFDENGNFTKKISEYYRRGKLTQIISV